MLRAVQIIAREVEGAETVVLELHIVDRAGFESVQNAVDQKSHSVDRQLSLSLDLNRRSLDDLGDLACALVSGRISPMLHGFTGIGFTRERHFTAGAKTAVCDGVDELFEGDALQHGLARFALLAAQGPHEVVGSVLIQLGDWPAPGDAVRTFREILLFRREADHALRTDHLNVAAEVAGIPDGIANVALAHEALGRIAVLVGLLLRVEHVDDAIAGT